MEQFKTKIADTLGIRRSRISIYSYTKGSTIVEYMVSEDLILSTEDKGKELDFLSNKMVKASKDLKFAKGNVLSVEYMVTTVNSNGLNSSDLKTEVINTKSDAGNGLVIDTNGGDGTDTATADSAGGDSDDEKTLWQKHGKTILIASAALVAVLFAILFCCCVLKKKTSSVNDDESVDEDEEIANAMKARSKTKSKIQMSSLTKKPTMVL